MISILAAVLVGAGFGGTKEHSVQDEKGRSPASIAQELEEQKRLISDKAAEDRFRRKLLLDRVRLPGDTQVCAVFSKSNSQCLVSVGRLNEAITNGMQPFPDGASGENAADFPAEVRKNVTDRFLENAYIRARMEESGQAERLRQKADEMARKTTKVLPDSLLQALFTLHKEAIEKALDERTFEIFASTDSALIYGLFDTLSKPGFAIPRTGVRGLFPRFLPRRDLPEPLFRLADSLPAGAWSSPIPCAFGHALFRMVPGQKTGRPGFEAALPILLRLASLRHSTKDTNGMMADYYQSHIAEFHRPDTVLLEVRLLPDGHSSLIAGLKGKSVALSALPYHVREFAASNFTSAKKSMVGPVSLDFGTWTFKLLAKRKGRGVQSFAEARERISRILMEVGANGEMPAAIREAEEKRQDIALEAYKTELLSSLGADFNAGSAADSLSTKDVEYRRLRYSIDRLDSLRCEWIRENIRVLPEIGLSSNLKDSTEEAQFKD